MSTATADLIHGASVYKADSDAFFVSAQQALQAIAPDVIRLIPDILGEIEGRWHPTGFAVLPLGAHSSLGTLRLHVWPANLRRRVRQGNGQLRNVWDGDVHNHAWNISSAVLRTYRDDMWSVSEPVDEEPAQVEGSDLFRPHSVSYAPGARQQLSPARSWVRGSVSSTRTVREGDFHTIRHGEFHAPSIPEGALSSTLVFSSPRVVSGGPDVLIQGTLRPVPASRRMLSRDDREIVQKQLASTVLRSDG